MIYVHLIIVLFGFGFTQEYDYSLEDINSRLTALDQITNGLPSEARMAAQLPCAFLVEGSCSIYEVRP